jgi:hypothetical protein
MDHTHRPTMSYIHNEHHHHALHMCRSFIKYHGLSAVIILCCALFFQKSNFIIIYMADEAPPNLTSTVLPYTICVTVLYPKQPIDVNFQSSVNNDLIMANVGNTSRFFYLLSLLPTKLGQVLRLCPLFPQTEHLTGESSATMNLLRLRIRFVFGRPDCRFGMSGSLVSPSYTVVSKHTGKTFFLKVLCTNSNV